MNRRTLVGAAAVALFAPMLRLAKACNPFPTHCEASGRRLREIYVDRGQVERCRMQDLREGDTFVIISNGEPVAGRALRATSAPRFNDEFKSWQIDIEVAEDNEQARQDLTAWYRADVAERVPFGGSTR